MVVQNDAFNRSRIATTVCVPLTTNMAWADAPGNVALNARHTGLPRDSVANVSLVFAVDRGLLRERAGRLRTAELRRVLDGMELILHG